MVIERELTQEITVATSFDVAPRTKGSVEMYGGALKVRGWILSLHVCLAVMIIMTGTY